MISWHIEPTSKCTLECPLCDRTWFYETFKKRLLHEINVNNLVNFLGQDAKISFEDGGFQRGNSIFETIRFNKNHLFSINSHLKRLRDGLNYLEFKITKTNEELINLYNQVAKNPRNIIRNIKKFKNTNSTGRKSTTRR